MVFCRNQMSAQMAPHQPRDQQRESTCISPRCRFLMSTCLLSRRTRQLVFTPRVGQRLVEPHPIRHRKFQYQTWSWRPIDPTPVIPPRHIQAHTPGWPVIDDHLIRRPLHQLVTPAALPCPPWSSAGSADISITFPSCPGCFFLFFLVPSSADSSLSHYTLATASIRHPRSGENESSVS